MRPAQLTVGGLTFDAKCSKFFISGVDFSAGPYSLTVYDREDAILYQIKFKFSRADDICFNVSDDFSYNSTSHLSVEVFKPHSSRSGFYLYVKGEYCEKLYEIIFCSK